MFPTTVCTLLVTIVFGAAPQPTSVRGEWKEVLYQAFQTGALSATIILHERVIRVPMGWDSISEPTEPDKRWTMARWDGANDKRQLERTYLVANGNGLPGCWLTKVLSYEVRPDFELQCIMLNFGTPVALTMRVVDDEGIGYDATLSIGVKDQPTQLRAILKRRVVKIVEGKKQIEPERTKVLVTASSKLSEPERLRWYRPKLAYKNGKLSLSLDDKVLVEKKVKAHRFTVVQFMSPQRVFLDDFEMWGFVNR